MRKYVKPTDKARQLETRIVWDRLQRAPKNQPITKWLEEWKKAYNKGVNANIIDIEGLRPVQAFIQIIQTFNPTWANSIQETYNAIGLPLPNLHTLVERYQQKTRICAVQSTKQANANTAFATLQGLNPNKTKDNTKTQRSLFRQQRQCLCKK